MPALLATLALVPALAAELTSPASRGPCFDPDPPPDLCVGLTYIRGFTPINASVVPTDGVLILALEIHGEAAPGLADRFDMTVTLGDTVVPGALEPTSRPEYLLWRPTAAWTPGGTHHVTGTYTNSDEAAACGDPVVHPFAFGFIVDTAPAAPLTAPTVTASVKFHQFTLLALDNLACCPGTAPSVTPDNCGNPSLGYDPYQCAPLSEDTLLDISLTVPPAVAGAASQQILYTLAIDDDPPRTSLGDLDRGLELEFFRDSPFCATVTATDLIRGTTLTGPTQCFGDNLADLLGPSPIEPELDCALQRCEVQDNTWDLDACTPLEPAGCGCRHAPTAPPWPLLTPILLHRRPRRP